MHKDIEIRKLPIGSLYGVVNILEINDDWKKVISVIPKNPDSDHFEPKYNEEHIRLIANYAKESNKKCAEILFDEWGTSGRIRPTLGILKDIILKAGVYRAADEIAYMLNEAPPTRPDAGPAAPITTNITFLLNGEATTMEQNFNSMFCNNNSRLQNNYAKQMSVDPMGNQVTVQIKSASDLIQFSKDSVRPNMEIPKVLHDNYNNNITQKMHSEEPEMVSMNIPNISALLKDNTTKFTSTITDSESTDTFNLPSKYSNVQTMSSSNNYQMSFPNIELHTGIDSSILQNTDVIYFEYKELEKITNNFSKDLVNSDNGIIAGRIGKGGFGEVFVGLHSTYGRLAVKKTHNLHQHESDLPVKLFNTEVKCLLQFRHSNIVPILGVSIDGPDLCIVCEYIDGGSLDRKLEEKVLNEQQRINIIIGIAEGLKYLHQSEKPVQGNGLLLENTETSETKRNKFIHGDIKSANVLLTKDNNAKLCDFGLSKQNYVTTFMTKCTVGTLGYMAPEAQTGTVTQKMDIYSFGIVLLELLTGLKVIVDNDSEKINIIDYIKENFKDDITGVLDPVVDKWTRSNEIYEIAQMCTRRDRKERPSIDNVCSILYKW